MAVVFDHPKSLLDVSTHFCPGCGHGIVHRLVCEVIDEMGIEGDTIGVVPVGCSVMSYNYFGCDVIEAPHGRAPAVATGAKRVNPDKSSFPIRATATWLPSVRLRPSMSAHVGKTSWSSLSTTRPTA